MAFVGSFDAKKVREATQAKAAQAAPVTNVAPAPTTLRDIANQNGWSVGYDDKTRQVTVTDPNNGGKTLSFASGGGQAYGLGGLAGGNNVVSDVSKLTGYFSPAQTVQTQQPPPIAQQIPSPYIEDINKLTSARQEKAILDLEKSKNAQLSRLTAEKSDISPLYYDKRNQASARDKIQAKNFAEYIANRGLANSGENTQAQLMQNMTTQAELGELDREENKAFQDIERRRSDVENAYQSDIASTKAGIEADALDRLMNERIRWDDVSYNRNQDTLNRAERTDDRVYNRSQDSLDRSERSEDRAYTRRTAQEERTYQREQDKLSRERQSKLDEITFWEFEQQKALDPFVREEAKQRVEKAKRDIAMIDLDLKYLPRKYEAEISATNRSNRGGGSGGSGGGGFSKTQLNDLYAQDMANYPKKAVEEAYDDLYNNAETFIDNYGYPKYKELWNRTFSKVFDLQKKDKKAYPAIRPL